MNLDTINWKILEILQANSRVALKEISQAVGLSSPSVAERIQKMEESGIIEGFTTKLNMENLGYGLGVYISIKIRFGLVEKFEQFIQTVPEICECHKLTGHDCMLMKGFVRDPKHLENLNSRLAVYGELTTSLILKSLVKNKIIDQRF